MMRSRLGRRPAMGQRGFSLLEMVVAMAILAFSLAILYEAVSGASRNVRTGEKYAYGVELANSLMANNALINPAGVRTTGETQGGFSWSVQSSPIEMRNSSLPRGALHSLQVTVSWQDGRKVREVILHSVVGGY